MAPSESPHSSSNVSEIDKTLAYLEEGKEKIRLEERYRNMTLVLGITGAGKSTFVQWLAGDNTKLISEKVPGTWNDFIVKDETRISNSTTQSMTIFPELVVDPLTGNAYYDCPGFSDTRSVSVDIAGTYFIKSVADYAENVRLLFTIGYNAVRVGMDRRQFTELLKHSTNLVKNVHKFRKSIALVVTKVENNVAGVDKNGKMIYVPDEVIIESIAKFMENVRDELAQDTTKANENFIELINVLLQKDGGNYSKIAIFRRPDMHGPLSEIPLLQEGKARLIEIVRRLELTPIEEQDFGYSISGDSKNTVHELANVLNDRVWKEAENITQVVRTTYRQTVEEIGNKIASFISATKSESVEANLVEAQAFAAKLKTANWIVSELSVSNVTTQVLAEKLNNTLIALEIDTMRDNVEQISLAANHLEFLQNVTDSTLVTKPWQNLLNDVVGQISTSKGSIQNGIDSSAEKLVLTVQSTIKDISGDLWNAKLNQIQSTDIQQLPDQLEHEVATIRTQTEIRPQNIEQLATLISKNSAVLGLETNLIKSNTQALFNSANYLDYLQTLSDRQLTTWSPEWTTPLDPTLQWFYESLDWYLFLNDLYSKLGEYKFQQDPSQYNVANLDDWGEGQNKQQDIQIDEKNFSQFLNKVSQYDIAAIDAIRNTQVAQWQLDELNRVLSLTLKHGPARPDCSEKGKLTITGDYVKLSDLKEKLVEMCPSSVSSVNIFSSKTVFIDGDLNGEGDKLKVTIMAPKWEVVDKRRINLDGSAGALPTPPKASNGKKPAELGQPGSPGGPAGSFLGVGQQFVNREDLTITANGGVGGAGQEGGDGPVGEPGESAAEPTSDCKMTGNHTLESSHSEMHGFENWDFRTYLINGTKGTKGGTGGDGGVGGIGGKPGAIQLFNLDDSTKQLIEAHQGSAGSGGHGGLGGYEGLHGDDIRAYCEFYFNWGFWTIKLGSFYNVKYEYSNRAQSGADGVNRQNILESEPASMIEHPAEVINEYKMFLRSNLNGVNDRFKRNTTIALMDRLDKTTQDVYDSLALADEFDGLEEQSPILRNKHDRIHYYESLSNRINTYANSPKSSEQSLQYKKMFNYLSAATLGRLYDLRSGDETSLIIDVEGYLKYVQDNMDTLNNLRVKHNEHEIVQNYKKKYNENIEQQVSEAKQFVENEIKKEFENIGKEIDDKIDKLIEATEKLEKEAKKNKKELEEKREQLKKQMVIRGIFSAVSVASQVLTFAGPHAAAIGTVVGGVSSITEGFVLDDKTGEGKEFKMPPGIKDNIKFVKEEYDSFFKDPAKKLKKRLDLMAQQIQPVPELNDLAKQLDSISRRIPSNPNEPNFTTALAELEGEAKKTMKEQMDKKEKSGEKWSKRAETAFKVANQVNQMGSVALDRYSKHRGDKGKLDEVDKALVDIDEKLKLIDDYKKAITDTMAPDMQKLMNNIDEINRNLDNKSLVALDVQQWKAQSMMRNLKVEIQRLLKDQDVEAEMMRCFEKLDEAVSINIKIYDRIQNFQQQQQLSDFIANVNSPIASGIQIEDEELARAVAKLEIVIRSNVVLQQFASTAVALKQLVFPYARHYIEPMNLPLPSKISLNSAYIDEMVANANEALEKMKLRLVENRTKISKVDKNSHIATFDSTKPCLQAPFYLWSNDQYSNALSKLLSGDSVALKADIRHSDPDKDAIRFSKVQLNFKAKNATLQPEIDAKLQKFMVSANHMGNSYYRYGGKYYAISSDAQNIKYSFAKTDNGQPMDYNKVYDKIENGDLMLSPYAMWQIQLSKMNRTVSFDELDAYKDQVDLELVGQGSYIESKAAQFDDLHVEVFYSESADDTRDEIDVPEQPEIPQVYSARVVKQTKCLQFMAMNKASNSIHGFNRLPYQDSNSTGTLSYMSRLGQTVSNYFYARSSSSTATPDTHIMHPRFDYRKQQQHQANSVSEASNQVDVHGNLLMSQLLVGMIAGKNKTLVSDSYLLPEQTHNVQVEQLAQRVMPVLSQSSATRYRSNQIHNKNTQWHREMFPENDNSRNHN